MAVGTVIARIASQYSDKGSKAAQKDLMKLGKQFDAYAKKATRAVGLVAVAAASAAVKIGKDSVMAASDVSQQFGALEAVFGKNAEQLKEFSKGMVEYGLSTADAARYAALLGTQLKGLGMQENDAIARTKELEILAADLAATYGGTTADAVQALSSTFKGEYNPIERYGVAIKKSDITARLAAQGLKGLKGETLKAAEAQAAYELIIMKTTAAQGQSKREYNTLAAQLQRLRASYSNITASLGEALLPVIQEFANYILVTVVPAVQAWVTLNKDKLAKGLQDMVEIFKDFMIAGGKFLEFLIKYDDAVKILTVSLTGLVVAFRLVAISAGLGGILTVLGKIGKRLDKTKMHTSLGRGSLTVLKDLSKVDYAIAVILNSFKKINAKAIFSGISKNWKGVLKTVGKKSPWITLGLYIDQIAKFFYEQIPGVKYVWDWIFNYGKNRITEAIDNFKKRFEFLGPLMEKVKPLWDGFYKYATLILGKIVDSLRNTWLGKLLGFGNEIKAKITLSADAQKVEDSVQAALKKTQTMDGARTDYLIKEEKRLAAIKEAERKRLAALQAKNDAAQAKSDAAEAKRNSVLNNLKKLGVKVTTGKTGSKLLKGVTPFSTLDPKMQEAVQFQAAYLLLLKQNNIAEAERLKAIVESKKSVDEAAKSLQRYDDILKALADNKISSDDVAILAKKWDMTTQQAASYIITALSVNKEGKVTNEAVDALSKAWGSTKEQAEKYLDFTLALADNVLSDKEIAKLQEKWGLTEKQVRQYADFTVKIADYKLDDTEINDLMNKWGLTREEVLKYVKQIGAPVSWNGQLVDPADEAERKWRAALDALMAYQAALAAGVGSSASSSSSSSSSSSASTAAAAASTAASAAAAASASASKAAAEAYAKAKAAGDMNAAAIAAAGVNPSALAAGESGAIGAASIAAQLRAAETALAVQKNATTLANFKAKEAEDLAASVAARAQLDYDERSKFRSMTLANASSVSGTSGSGAVTVNLTVNGSVSTEKDLVATVRQGLLAGQYNGQTLTLEAI